MNFHAPIGPVQRAQHEAAQAARLRMEAAAYDIAERRLEPPQAPPVQLHQAQVERIAKTPSGRDFIWVATPPEGPLWKRIVMAVCVRRLVAWNEIMSNRRDVRVVWARQEAMYDLRNQTSMSFPEIGRKMGRDHTTVLHSVRKHEERMKAGLV